MHPRIPPSEAIFFLMGVSLILPLGALLARNTTLAGRLLILPRIAFGLICFAVAFLPGTVFPGVANPDTGTILAARILFSAMGSYLLARGILRLRRRRRDRKPPAP